METIQGLGSTGPNNYAYHLEVHLRYHRPYLNKDYGTIMLVII